MRQAVDELATDGELMRHLDGRRDGRNAEAITRGGDTGGLAARGRVVYMRECHNEYVFGSSGRQPRLPNLS